MQCSVKTLKCCNAWILSDKPWYFFQVKVFGYTDKQYWPWSQCRLWRDEMHQFLVQNICLILEDNTKKFCPWADILAQALKKSFPYSINLLLLRDVVSGRISHPVVQHCNFYSVRCIPLEGNTEWNTIAINLASYSFCMVVLEGKHTRQGRLRPLWNQYQFA